MEKDLKLYAALVSCFCISQWNWLRTVNRPQSTEWGARCLSNAVDSWMRQNITRRVSRHRVPPPPTPPPPPPLTSTLCQPDTCIVHMTKFPRPFPLNFAYCKRSKTGGGNGLGTRLVIEYPQAVLPPSFGSLERYMRLNLTWAFQKLDKVVSRDHFFNLYLEAQRNVLKLFGNGTTV